MPKQKLFDYPIKELEELLRDIRQDWKDLKYWEGIYAGCIMNSDIIKALRGVRYKKTKASKKMLSVELAIQTLEEHNLLDMDDINSLTK